MIAHPLYQRPNSNRGAICRDVVEELFLFRLLLSAAFLAVLFLEQSIFRLGGVRSLAPLTLPSHPSPASHIFVTALSRQNARIKTRWDVATVILASFGLMIAAAGGIGGGGILVPIFILVLRFGPKYAVPLSNITIFGGAITNTFLNMKKRHPLADRPLVDWDLILVMEPLTSEFMPWCRVLIVSTLKLV